MADDGWRPVYTPEQASLAKALCHRGLAEHLLACRDAWFGALGLPVPADHEAAVEDLKRVVDRMDLGEFGRLLDGVSHVLVGCLLAVPGIEEEVGLWPWWKSTEQ